VVGEAEPVWAELLDDAAARRLRPQYRAAAPPRLAGWPCPDRSVYSGRRYGPLALVETSRGCRNDCEFCSIASFFRQDYRARPVDEVAREVRSLAQRNIFFVDDNLGVDPARLRDLCEALIPLRRRWIGQTTLRLAQDEALLRLMRRSGCVGVLIGFESLSAGNLTAMGKAVNADGLGYDAALERLRRHGLGVYGTFVFGYDDDTPDAFEETFRFAMRHRLFFAAFNHLVPFPGTRVYARFLAEQRLVSGAWWLEPQYRFGSVAFRPARLSAEDLAALCLEYRRRFYSPGSVCRRALDFRGNCGSVFKAGVYLAQNVAAGREVERRHGLPLGFIGEGG